SWYAWHSGPRPLHSFLTTSVPGLFRVSSPLQAVTAPLTAVSEAPTQNTVGDQPDAASALGSLSTNGSSSVASSANGSSMPSSEASSPLPRPPSAGAANSTLAVSSATPLTGWGSPILSAPKLACNVESPGSR